jgi:hypothetical protein
MKFGFSILALNVALAGAVAPAAIAQTKENNPFFRHRFIAVTERAQPEYDPQPLHAGAFMINSSLGVAAIYNDNIYAQHDKKSDGILDVTPQVDVKTNWTSNEFNAGALVDNKTYLDNDTENVLNYRGYVGGRLDVTRTFSISAQANGGRFSEDRYAASQVGGIAKPIRYDRTGGFINANYRFNRILLDGTVDVTKYDYSDVYTLAGATTPGGPIVPSQVVDEDFRDATVTSFGGRASYAISPDVAGYVQLRHDNVDYRVAPTSPDLDRNANRNFYQVGANFELAAPFRGDIAVGYLTNKQKSGRDSNGLAVDGRLQWFPTEITTVSFTAERTVFDPDLLHSSTAFDTSVGVRVDHELRRNIVLFGDLRYEQQDFRDIDRKDDITSFSTGVGYKLNRRARLELAYTLRDESTKGAAISAAPDFVHYPGPDFTQNIVSVALRLFP